MDDLLRDYDRLPAEEADQRMRAATQECLITLAPLNMRARLPFLQKACQHAARRLDGTQFERLFALLLPVYLTDPHKDGSDDADRRLMLTLIGLQLLNLLVTGRKGSFDVLVAQLPPPWLANPLLSFVLQLDRALVQGAYASVLQCDGSQSLPAPEYALFIKGLEERLRLDIATTLTACYTTLPLGRCLALLMLPATSAPGTDAMAMLRTIAQHQRWQVHQDVVHLRDLGRSADSNGAAPRDSLFDSSSHDNLGLLHKTLEHLAALQGPSLIVLL